MSLVVAKAKRAERKTIVEKMNALLPTDGGSMTAENLAGHAKLDADQEKLRLEIDALEKQDTLNKQMNARAERTAVARGVSTDEITEEQQERNAAFNNFMRFGMNALSPEHRSLMQGRLNNDLPIEVRNALSTDPATSGGYLIPEGFGGQIIEAEKAYGGMLEASYVFDTDTGNPLPFPTDNDTTNSGGLLSENKVVPGQDIAFGAVTLQAYTYTSKLVLVSLQLLQDSVFDLNTYMARKLGTRLGRAVNTDFTTGNGASRPTGVITAATLGRTGTTGQTTSIISDDLFELKHSVDPAYRKGASWMMADSSLKVIKKLKDGVGRPLWSTGIAVKEPDTIDGDPYIINQDMAAMAANAKSVAYGDFSKYFIRRVKDVTLLRLTERYADFLQVGFIAFQRVDGNLMDAGTHPVKYYANSAS